MSATLIVNIVSDVVWPWCSIGKARLEKAIAKAGIKAQVLWRPFFLNPNLPAEGVVKHDYYLEKFGPQVNQIETRLKGVFAEEGLEFSTGGKTGPTMSAHRLIAYAETFGTEKQNLLVEELFKNYFGQEKFLNDKEVLIAAAEKVGITGAVEIINDPKAYESTVIEQYNTYAKGVRGVPFFILEAPSGKTVTLSGAQPVDAFIDAFSHIA